MQAHEKGVAAPWTSLPVLFSRGAELGIKSTDELDELMVANVITRRTRGINDD